VVAGQLLGDLSSLEPPQQLAGDGFRHAFFSVGYYFNNFSCRQREWGILYKPVYFIHVFNPNSEVCYMFHPRFRHKNVHSFEVSKEIKI
jgi:hypothetical protein